MANVYAAENDLSYAKRISWSAIFAGTFVAIGVEVLLALLGMSIGLGTINADQGGLKALGTGSLIWWFISGLIALFCGGWVAGKLCSLEDRLYGALHGLVTWAFVAFVSLLFLTTSVGGLIGGAYSAVQSGLRSQPSNALTQDLQSQARKLMNKADQAVNPTLNKVNPANPNAQAPSLTPQERSNAENAARTVSKASLVAFFALLLGAVCAAFGGMEAIPSGPEGFESRGTAATPSPQLSR